MTDTQDAPEGTSDRPAIPECLNDTCSMGCTTECRAVINAAWRHLNPAAAERADHEQRNRQARAFNAVAPALKAHDQWLPLSVRKAVADAVLAAVEENDQPASTAPLAAGLPLVQGHCPACGSSSLFLGNGGYVTCSRIDCPQPDAASTVLERTAPAARRPQLPDEVLALLSPYPYLSTACETGRRVDAATIRYPERADLPAWVERLHRQCPLTHKFTGDPCNCRCHRPTA